MFPLWPPKGDPTPRNKAVFLALGSTERGDMYTWDTLPSFPVRVDLPTFPILILCRDEDEFHRLRAIAPWIHQLAQSQLDSRQRVADALELLRNKPSIQSLLTSERPAWPVFGGNGGIELIAFLWADAHELYLGQDEPKIGTKRTTLLDALVWFVLRDIPPINNAAAIEDLKSFTAELSQLRLEAANTPNIASLDGHPPLTPGKTKHKKPIVAMEPIVIESESETEMPAPAATKAGKGTPKRAAAARTAVRTGSRAENAATTPVLVKHENTYLRPAGGPLTREAARRGSSSSKAPDSGAAVESTTTLTSVAQPVILPLPNDAAASTVKQGGAGGTARRAAAVSVGTCPCDAGPPRPNMHQHIRDVYGRIIASHVQFYRSHEVTLPSFGAIVDNFLDTFGFPDEFCFILAACYDHAQDVAQFCNMMGQCVSFAEAYWFWHSVRRQHPSQQTRTRECSIASA